MTNLDYREITKSVLKLAVNLDERIPMPDSARVDAWMAVLKGRVWPQEAEAAVYDHYVKVPCGMLMPGDVISFCERQPVWSSREHAQDWILRVGIQNPYSGAIEAYSGITEPAIDIPDSTPRSEHRAYLTAQLKQWATPRLDELAAAIVATRFEPWWRNR